MKKWLVSFLVLGGVFSIIAIWAFMTFIGISNHEVELKNQFNAQVEANKTIYDNFWKVLQEKAGVATEYAEKAKVLYVQVMDAHSRNWEIESCLFEEPLKSS